MNTDTQVESTEKSITNGCNKHARNRAAVSFAYFS